MNSYEERRSGQAVTLQTKAESYVRTHKSLRRRQVIEVLREMYIMTAREISVDMFRRGLIPSDDRNYTAPRLNELAAAGIVEVCGTKKCQFTGRKVSAYKLTDKKFSAESYKSLGIDPKEDVL